MTANEEALDQIRHLKTQAKNRRDSGRFGRALGYLEKAAAVAKAHVGDPPQVNRDFAGELADVYGIMGGVTRRQGLSAETDDDRADALKLSVEYYDEGFKYEKPEYGVVNSYNLVNRLVGRILSDPSCLDDTLPEDAVPADESMEDMLRDAQKQIAAQVDESRNRDPWALADMALIEILLLPSATAGSAYGPLHRTSPPSYVYESALSTLRPLADTASDRRPELGRAVMELDARLAAR